MFNSKDTILPPGHNCLTSCSALKAVLASGGAAAFSSKARPRRPNESQIRVGLSQTLCHEEIHQPVDIFLPTANKFEEEN
jgi:hypothetical protein